VVHNPDELLEGVFRVCADPQTLWARSNAQCALDGEKNHGRGFVLTRAGFHHAAEPEAQLAQSRPLPSHPQWLCYLWEPVFIPVEAVRAILSLFREDLRAAAGLDKRGRPLIGAKLAAPPWRMEDMCVVPEPTAAAPPLASEQALRSPLMNRLFPHADCSLSVSKFSPRVNPMDISRLMSKFYISERDVLFVLQYAEAVLVEIAAGRAPGHQHGPACVGETCTVDQCLDEGCTSSLFELLGMDTKELVSLVKSNSTAYRDLVGCQLLPPKSIPVLDGVLASWDEDMEPLDFSEVAPECFVSFDDEPDEESEDDASDGESWALHEFHGTERVTESALTTSMDEMPEEELRAIYDVDEDTMVVIKALREGRELSGPMAIAAKELLAQKRKRSGLRAAGRSLPLCAYDSRAGEYAYVVDGVVDSKNIDEDHQYWVTWAKATSRRCPDAPAPCPIEDLRRV